MNYKAMRNVCILGDLVYEGETVVLDEKSASIYLESGMIEKINAEEPKVEAKKETSKAKA